MTLSLMEPGDVRTPTCSKRVSCYRLGLANGLAWHLVTTAQSEQWIARIAAVMQLKRGDAADLTDTFEGAGSVRGESALLAPAPGRRAKRMRHGALTIEQLAGPRVPHTFGAACQERAPEHRAGVGLFFSFLRPSSRLRRAPHSCRARPQGKSLRSACRKRQNGKIHLLSTASRTMAGDLRRRSGGGACCRLGLPRAPISHVERPHREGAQEKLGSGAELPPVGTVLPGTGR